MLELPVPEINPETIDDWGGDEVEEDIFATGEFDKVVGQFRLQLNGVLEPFNLYGMHTYVPVAIKLIESLAVQLHHKLSGLDIPYYYDEKDVKW